MAMLELKKIHDPDFIIPVIELSLNGMPVISFTTDKSFEVSCEVNPDFARKEVSIGSMSQIVVMIANAIRDDIENFKSHSS